MFQQGSSNWCIMTTLKKTPENRLSVSRTTLIKTVIEQNCSVKRCCCYLFTLSISNGHYGNTRLSIIKSICDFRLFWGTQFRRSVKYSWSKIWIICAQTRMAYTLPAEQGDFKVKDSRVCERHYPDTPQPHNHTATYSPHAHWEQNERCSTTKEHPDISFYKNHSVWPSMQVPKCYPSLGLLNGI